MALTKAGSWEHKQIEGRVRPVITITERVRPVITRVTSGLENKSPTVYVGL